MRRTDFATPLLRNNYRIEGRRSLDRVNYALDHLIEYFGEDCRAVNITTDQIEKYALERQKPRQRQVRKRLPDGGYETVTVTEVTANGTINRELAALKRGFRLAAQARRLVEIPQIPILKEAEPRQGFLEYSDFVRLRDALPDHLRDGIEFLYRSGWRKNEMATLEWRDVDLKAGVVKLRPEISRNGEGRELPLIEGSELRAIFERAHKNRRLSFGSSSIATASRFAAVGRHGRTPATTRRSVTLSFTTSEDRRFGI